MKKLFSFCILYILFTLAANAQQEPQISNYMLTKPIINPAFVGAEKTINAYFMNRAQFAGFGEHKPVTSVFGVETPVDILGTKSGLGLVIINDAKGFINDVKVSLKYAYHHQLQSGKVSGGIDLGFNNISIAEPIWIPTEEGSVDSDPAIPNALSELAFNLGAGFYYETTEYFIGLSATNLTSPEIFDPETEQTTWAVTYYAPHFYLSGAYNIALPDPLFDLQPAFLLSTDLTSTKLDLNATMLYNKKYWAGLGLRVTPYKARFGQYISSVNILGGIMLINGLNLGYAMDLNLTNLQGGATSHEILVTYSFNLEGKRDQKYKSVRYL